MNRFEEDNSQEVPYEDVPMEYQGVTDDSYEEEDQSLGKLVEQNAEIVKVASRGLDLISQMTEVYRESQQLNAKVEVVKEYGKLQLAKTAAKFYTTKSIIEEVFGERREALSSYYKVLDNAIKSGNENMIVQAMQMIGSVVVSSPLSQIQNFIKAFEDKDQPLLDF